MSNITLPAKDTVKNISFLGDVSENSIIRSFDTFTEKLIPDT